MTSGSRVRDVFCKEAVWDGLGLVDPKVLQSPKSKTRALRNAFHAPRKGGSVMEKFLAQSVSARGKFVGPVGPKVFQKLPAPSTRL